MSSWKQTRAQLAAEVRHNGPDSPRAGSLRRELKATRADDYIHDLVSGWPPLTARQLAALSDVLAAAARAAAAQQERAGAADRGAA
jgi:hypothetical protein